MTKGAKLFTLVYSYAIFIVWFMQCCDWCIRCSLMFYLVPSVLICSILHELQIYIPLRQRVHINFFKWFLGWVNVYYTICAYKKYEDKSAGQWSYKYWVKQHANFFLYFVFLAVVFHAIRWSYYRFWQLYNRNEKEGLIFGTTFILILFFIFIDVFKGFMV